MSYLSGDIPNAVVPKSGGNYAILNIGTGNWIDNAASIPIDGNPVISWDPNIPATDNMIYTYTTLPSGSGETIFTLQCISTTKGQAGKGGYVRVDNDNKLVQGGEPMTWKLVEPLFPLKPVYKFIPLDDKISRNGTLAATDINPIVTSIKDNQVTLCIEQIDASQFWAFFDRKDVIKKT
ncbi:hypothetical protein M0805_008851 [Coniferiporia weirii]|nr:hypothetical protein M0805_008851 [Coniferiporia weirii]